MKPYETVIIFLPDFFCRVSIRPRRKVLRTELCRAKS